MSVSVPKVQTAAVIQTQGAPLTIQSDYPVVQPEDLAPGECLVKLEFTGVCHTDLHAALGDWPLPTKMPLVGGHEGIGIVVAIASGTVSSPVRIGDRVGIKFNAKVCMNCEMCLRGYESCMSLPSNPLQN